MASVYTKNVVLVMAGQLVESYKGQYSTVREGRPFVVCFWLESVVNRMPVWWLSAVPFVCFPDCLTNSFTNWVFFAKQLLKNVSS